MELLISLSITLICHQIWFWACGFGIKPSLPFKGFHLLLGNDLAGDKVVVNPLVTDTPNIGQTDDPIEQEIPGLYPSCAVTRAMAKKVILKNSNSDIDLADTFIG